MNEAFLGLGGNIGNRLENLAKIREAIRNHGGDIISESGIYETEAWGSDSQNKYLNQVIKIKTALTAEALLDAVLNIERSLGRERSGPQNSDRTADIDILLYNDVVFHQVHLHIPHPRLHLRKFVLIPLCDIAPALVHPVLKKTVSTLLSMCNDELQVIRISGC